MSDEELLEFMEEEGGGVTYATWNPADKDASLTLSNGDLTASATMSVAVGLRATISKTTGKWFWEITLGSLTATNGIGVATSAEPLNTYMINVYGWTYLFNGRVYHNNSAVSSGHPAFAVDMVIGVAFDADAGDLWFSVDGTWIGSGIPSTGTNPALSGITGTIFPCSSFGNATSLNTANFGASPFAHTVPSGFNSGLYE